MHSIGSGKFNTCNKTEKRRVPFKGKPLLDILYAYYGWNWQVTYEFKLWFEIWYQGMIWGHIWKSNSLYVFSDSFHSVQTTWTNVKFDYILKVGYFMVCLWLIHLGKEVHNKEQIICTL